MSTNASRPAVTLVINTSGQAPQLRAILAAVFAGSELPAQVVIAEDGVDSATAAVVAEVSPSAPCPVVHRSQEKRGFRRSSILNAAIAASSGDYLVFLDGDCIPHRDFIADHRRVARPGFFVQGRRAFVREAAVPGCLTGKFSPLRLFLKGALHGVMKGVRFPFPLVCEDADLHGVLGCNLGIHRTDLSAVNGYDESFVGWGKEDSDLAARLYHLGRRRRVVRNHAVIYHLDHPVADRSGLPTNEHRLAETLTTRRVRCETGLDRHTPAA